MKDIKKLRTAIFMGRTDEALSMLSYPEVTRDINDLVLGDTCLHVACDGGLVNVARALIERGADIEKLNRQGETPLHNAASKGKLQCVELLIRKGADQTRVDRHGKTARDLAKFRLQDDVVNYLDGLVRTPQGAMTGSVQGSSGLPPPPTMAQHGYPPAPNQGYPPPPANHYAATVGYPPPPTQSHPPYGTGCGRPDIPAPYPASGGSSGFPAPSCEGYPYAEPNPYNPCIPQPMPGYPNPQAYPHTPVKQTKSKKKQKECSDLENHAKEVDREMERMMSSMSRGFEKMFGFKD